MTPATSAHPFGGIYASIVCPMHPDGAIDETSLARHADEVFAGTGLAGFLLNGHAGENALLAPEETARVIAIVQRACPTARIVAGINREGSAAASDLARIAARAGADAIMVFAPFSWALGADQRAILAHHAAIHAATDLPFFLFQGAVRSGLAYPPAVLARLLDLPRLVGVKEGSWDVEAYRAVRRQALAQRPDVAVMASGDEHLAPCFRLGSEGSLVSLAAILPAEIAALDAAVRRGDDARADALHASLQPLAEAIYGRPPSSLATARIKACLAMLGRIPSEACRAPIPSLDPGERADLARALARAGLVCREAA